MSEIQFPFALNPYTNAICLVERITPAPESLSAWARGLRNEWQNVVGGTGHDEFAICECDSGEFVLLTLSASDMFPEPHWAFQGWTDSAQAARDLLFVDPPPKKTAVDHVREALNAGTMTVAALQARCTELIATDQTERLIGAHEGVIAITPATIARGQMIEAIRTVLCEVGADAPTVAAEMTPAGLAMAAALAHATSRIPCPNCGGETTESQLMNASLGTACPGCYDQMSE